MSPEKKSPSRDQHLDDALDNSFPASDPPSIATPTTGNKAARPETRTRLPDDELNGRIRGRAEKLWREAGSPATGVEAFLDDARTLLAIEDNPKAGTLPNPINRPDNIGPEGEPIEPTLAVENEGEFPGLTDQGEQVYPPRRPGRA